MVQFTISQEGANIALEETWGQSLQSFDPQEFKGKYVAYVKEHVHLTSKDRTIALGEGGIKLGAHETKMTFMLPDLASDFEELKMHIPLFKTLEGQHTIVRIDKAGIKSKAILKASNSYKAIYHEDGDVTYPTIEKSSNPWVWISLVSVFVIAIFLIFNVKWARALSVFGL